jgi:glycosyltransferase involved in cell wall biosynthesis
MTFSIIIPTHNGERYLRSAIESALKQTRPADEIVIIDDASTDATAEIARSYGSKIKYHFSQKSTGFVDAWHRIIEKATGDFVTILHQDDLLHQDYLSHMEAALNKFPQIRHLYSGCNYINELGDIIKSTPQPHSVEPKLYPGKKYAKSYLKGVITNRHIHRCPGVTTDRKLLLEQCTYRKEAGHIADDDFFLRVGAFTDVVGISLPLASFRHHAESFTSKAESLTLNLAQDYFFQTCYYKENITILDNEDILTIKRQAVKFINLLLFQSILYNRKDWTSMSINLRIAMDEMSPKFMEKNLPAWAKPLWLLTYMSKGHSQIATFYVKILNLVLKIRKSLTVNF